MLAAFFALQYLLAPVLFTWGTVPAGAAGHGWLQEAADRLAGASGVGRVRVYIAPSSVPNAYAISSPLRRAVVINRGLLGLLSRREVEAVLGHELGHIKHRDNAYLLGVSFAPTLLHWLGLALLVFGVGMVYAAAATVPRSRDEEDVSIAMGLLGLGIAAIGALVVLGMILVYIPIRAFTRLREHLADVHSASLTRDESLISALRKIEEAISQLRAGQSGPAAPSLRNMLYIAPALAETLFSTHPSLEQRALIVRAHLRDLGLLS